MKNNFCFKKVMMIDDDYIVRTLVTKMLKKYHFANEIISCETGSEAIKYLRENSFSLPCIIILDINMPEMNGFEFLERFDKLNIKKKDNCFIIMNTSSANPEDIKRAEENQHVQLFLTKPLTILKLEAIKHAFSNSLKPD
ncbi:response regulator [Danxiaibacter flavus]|uniref:Response regulator n=1 Tax=Danxiaibacter flavus TaxID=3049108 RepID=A0ABV3ZLP2_9BACT|nr:response regulator [Chitinophagaceae bacterium DXS]